MRNKLSDIQLEQLSAFISRKTGLYFPEARFADLERGLISVAHEFGFQDPADCIQWIGSGKFSRWEIEIVSSHLTIGETYFFRIREQFTMLEKRILPELINARKNTTRVLRIWSAGCCSGEEPYSLAILIQKLIPDYKSWNISITATDINPSFLQKAEIGVYSNWSFRETPSAVKDRFFSKISGNRYQLISSVKDMVTFSYMNLADDSSPYFTGSSSGFDILLCRNVLMYFDQPLIDETVKKFHRAVSPDGWFIVSPVELSLIRGSGFSPVTNAESTVFRKSSGKTYSYVDLLIHDGTFLPPAGETKTEVHKRVVDLCQEPVSMTIPTISSAKAADEKPHPADADLDTIGRARRFFEEGRYDESIREFLAMAEPDISDPFDIMILVKAYANTGQLESAGMWCEKALSLDKTNREFHFFYGTVLQELGRTDEATASFQRALYLDPDFILAHVAIGMLANKRGHKKESQKHFQNALAILQKYHGNDIVEESEGISARKLGELIFSFANREFTI